MIVKAPEGRWCDYCKLQWGKVKYDGPGQTQWHLKAKTAAVVLCISETPLGKNNERAYCAEHRAELSEWAQDEVWPLVDQMEYVKKLDPKQLRKDLEANVQLKRL
jgi:hypothetical protein